MREPGVPKAPEVTAPEYGSQEDKKIIGNTRYLLPATGAARATQLRDTEGAGKRGGGKKA